MTALIVVAAMPHFRSFERISQSSWAPGMSSAFSTRVVASSAALPVTRRCDSAFSSGSTTASSNATTPGSPTGVGGVRPKVMSGL